MKKMKRLVAVLLAGVMALTMLTACGGPTCEQKTGIKTGVIDYFTAGISGISNVTFAEITDNDVITCFDELAKKAATKIAKNPTAYSSGDALSKEWAAFFNEQQDTLGAYYSLPLILTVSNDSQVSDEYVADFFNKVLTDALNNLIETLNPNNIPLDIEIHAQVYYMESSNSNHWILFTLGSATPSADT